MKQLKLDYTLEVFLQYMKDAGLVKRTITRRMCDMQVFFSFLKRRNVTDARDIGPGIIVSFFKSLATLITAKRKKPFSAYSRSTLLSTLKQFFRSLYVNVHNPVICCQ